MVFLLVHHLGFDPQYVIAPLEIEPDLGGGILEMFHREKLDQLEVDLFRKYFLGNSPFKISGLIARVDGDSLFIDNCHPYIKYNLFYLENFSDGGTLGNSYCQICKDTEEAREEVFSFFRSNPSYQDIIDRMKVKYKKSRRKK